MKVYLPDEEAIDDETHTPQAIENTFDEASSPKIHNESVVSEASAGGTSPERITASLIPLDTTFTLLPSLDSVSALTDSTERV